MSTSENRRPSGHARGQRGENQNNYWDQQKKINKQKLADVLRKIGMPERVNAEHGRELPTRVNPGSVGQVTSYNSLPARSK